MSDTPRKTPVYAIAQLQIHDRARYRSYVDQFHAVLDRFGGGLLAADESPEVIEGSSKPDKVVLLRFASAAAFWNWAGSDAYQQIARHRAEGAATTAILVHGLEPASSASRYDAIGVGYATVRREDPGLRAKIHQALGDARTVVNVGAGAGSYEPIDRHVIAIEPSHIMAAQRPRSAAPAVRATADDLPLCDGSVDAAMAILTLHHWSDPQAGVQELRRVCRGPIVIVTIDARVSRQMWLMAEYLQETARLDDEIFPCPELVAEWLGGNVEIEAWPVPRDTPDWTLASYWAHPERALDPIARSATSGFARMPADVVERVVRELDRDLASGAWDAKHAHLRTLDAYDAGVRVIVAR